LKYSPRRAQGISTKEELFKCKGLGYQTQGMKDGVLFCTLRETPAQRGGPMPYIISLLRNYSPFIAVAVLSLTSCVSGERKDVRPGLDGLHRVIIRTDDITEGSREAVTQADFYCQEINKSAFFFNDESKSKGANKATANTTPAAPAAKAPAGDGGDEDAPSSEEKRFVVDMLFKCL
jgi:hypothetical protein